jgi:hypothetical protein
MNMERQRGRVPSCPPICAQIARLRSFEGCAWLCAMNLTEDFLAVTHAA